MSIRGGPKLINPCQTHGPSVNEGQGKPVNIQVVIGNDSASPHITETIPVTISGEKKQERRDEKRIPSELDDSESDSSGDSHDESEGDDLGSGPKTTLAPPPPYIP